MRTTGCYFGSAVLHACGLALAAWGGSVVTSPDFSVVQGSVTISGGVAELPIDTQWDSVSPSTEMTVAVPVALPLEQSLTDATATRLAELPRTRPITLKARGRMAPPRRVWVEPFVVPGDDALAPAVSLPEPRPAPPRDATTIAEANPLRSNPREASEDGSQSTADSPEASAEIAESPRVQATSESQQPRSSPERPSSPERKPSEERVQQRAANNATPKTQRDTGTSVKNKEPARQARATKSGSAPSDSTGAKVDRYPRELPGNRSPEYPAEARRLGVEGVVYLLAEVGRDGRARHLKVYRSSGNRSLDASATRAVTKWRFQPATRSGQPVPCRVVVPVRFRILDE